MRAIMHCLTIESLLFISERLSVQGPPYPNRRTCILGKGYQMDRACKLRTCIIDYYQKLKEVIFNTRRSRSALEIIIPV